MSQQTSNTLDLTTISVNVDELFEKVKEMKEAGEKVVELQIFEPMPDIELGKHLGFEALGTAYGGGTDYEWINEASPEQIESALWNEELEEDIPEGYEIVKEITIIHE